MRKPRTTIRFLEIGGSSVSELREMPPNISFTGGFSVLNANGDESVGIVNDSSGSLAATVASSTSKFTKS